MKTWILIASLIGLTACGGEEQEKNNGKNNGWKLNNRKATTGQKPKVHRPEKIECDNTRPMGDVNRTNSVPNAECNNDSDCSEGKNGRCNNARGGSVCSYDSCFTDSDCGGKVCLCEASRAAYLGNHCSSGDCQTDDDCGNSYCSPSLGSCGDYGGVVGFFCHTNDDECVDDIDCKDGGYCMFSQEVEHWLCGTAQCVG